jgi:hypothetical protein
MSVLISCIVSRSSEISSGIIDTIIPSVDRVIEIVPLIERVIQVINVLLVYIRALFF